MSEEIIVQEVPEFKQSSKIALPVILGFLLFGLVLGSVNDTIKVFTSWGGALVLVGGALTFPDWKKKLSLPFVPLVTLVGLCGISISYALARKFALYEFLGVFLGLILFLFFLMTMGSGKQIAGSLTVAMTLVSFFSIDLMSTRTFYHMLESVTQNFTMQYSDLKGVEVGVRMTSLLSSPNIYAGCAGIAVLLSLGLVTHSSSKREQRFYLLCLSVNSLGFLLAFSMGATASIFVAFVVYLCAERKEQRLSLFILMVETFMVTLCAAFPIFLTSFVAWTESTLTPLLVLCLATVALIFFHEMVATKVVRFLAKDTKKGARFMAVGVAVIAVYGMCAVTMTTSYTFESSGSLRRSLYPSGGEYHFEVDMEGSATVTVTSQNREQTMMHTNSVLYRGDVMTAEFTVPEDSIVVYVTFAGQEGTILNEVRLSDGTAIDLHYSLLPGFISNRLQGLFANQNAIQRTVFFEDGMKLFSRSPVFGLGMGSFENALFQVQSFFYETKYVHNHYIQLLLEVGMLGCAAFIALFVSVMYGLKKAMKQEESIPMVAMSCALMVFMFTHAGVEVVWSSCFYLIFAFGVLAIIAFQLEGVCYHEKNPLTRKEVALAGGCVMGLFLGLLFMNVQASKIMAESTEEEFMTDLVKASQIDFFESQDYMTSYVNSAIGATNTQIQEQAEEYIQVLEKISSNSIPYYIALYYIGQDDVANAAEALVSYVTYVSSNSNAWNVAFSILLNHYNSSNALEVTEAVDEIYQIMLEWNEANMGNISLDKDIHDLVKKLLGLS